MPKRRPSRTVQKAMRTEAYLNPKPSTSVKEVMAAQSRDERLMGRVGGERRANMTSKELSINEGTIHQRYGTARAVAQSESENRATTRKKPSQFKNAGSSTWQQTPSTRKKGGY